MHPTPATTSSAPATRPQVIDCLARPMRAKWSSSMAQSNWPETTRAMNTAAPSFSVSAAPARTIIAPSGPPIQFHHSVFLTASMLGAGGRKISISSTAVVKVPQIEKKAANQGS